MDLIDFDCLLADTTAHTGRAEGDFPVGLAAGGGLCQGMPAWGF